MLVYSSTQIWLKESNILFFMVDEVLGPEKRINTHYPCIMDQSYRLSSS